MFTNMPDITPAQILAAVTAVVAQLVNAQLIDGRTQHLIVGLAGIIVPAAWMLADAIIRHGRSRALAPAAHAQTGVPPTPPPTP